MPRTQIMTEGRPLRLIVGFALPLTLGYALQQVYNIVDSAVVGRLIGVDAFAAVGAAGFLNWMVFAIILGLTQGFGILFAQRFGAGDLPGLRRAVGTSAVLSLGLGIAITAVSLLLARPIMTAIHTPEEILDYALTYLYWIFSAHLITIFYNLASAILRALGDSRTPLFALVISTIFNVVLDIWFVSGLGMGVEGVAIATNIAQVFSLAFCLWRIGKIGALRPSREEWKPHGPTARELMRLGTPLAFRNTVIALGGMVVQSIINGYGTTFMAGISAPKRYFGLLEIIGGALDGAVATFVGQNYGAGRMDRVKEGMRDARWLAVGSAVAVALVLVFIGRWLLGLLVGTGPEVAEVIDIGYRYLMYMAACLPALYVLFIHRSALQGMGSALVPMLSGFVELGVRLFCVLFLARWIGQLSIFLADGMGWVGAAVLLVVAYEVVFRRHWREYEAREGA